MAKPKFLKKLTRVNVPDHTNNNDVRIKRHSVVPINKCQNFITDLGKFFNRTEKELSLNDTVKLLNIFKEIEDKNKLLSYGQFNDLSKRFSTLQRKYEYGN